MTAPPRGLPATDLRIDEDLEIPAGDVTLRGDLTVPPDASGVVIFAHGSGSGRFSPRNRFVATTMNQAGLATLLVDLLTSREGEEDAESAHLRFDIPLLADRVVHLVDWAHLDGRTRTMRVGLFGSSTGGGAALVAAGARPDGVDAVVSRGGRPDLAEPHLDRVESPTLLIVGERDDVVIELNERALSRLRCEKRLEVIPGASHLFEEPGALEEVALLAADWLNGHLAEVP